MSSVKARLAKIEKAARAAGAGQVRTFIYYEGQDAGTCDRQPMTLAEWQRTKGAQDITIKVRYASDKPISTIAIGSRPVQTIGIDAGLL